MFDVQAALAAGATQEQIVKYLLETREASGDSTIEELITKPVKPMKSLTPLNPTAQAIQPNVLQMLLAGETQKRTQATPQTQPKQQSLAQKIGKLLRPKRAPIAGRITQGFDTPVGYIKGRKVHGGLDIAAALGTAIPIQYSGEVIDAAPGGGWGNQVLVRGDDGVIRRYAHLSQFGVQRGQKVKPGDIIGKTGSTGKSTGPHLHYEEFN